MGRGFVMVGNLFRGHPPGEHPWQRNPFFIREIRGSNCCFWDDGLCFDLAGEWKNGISHGTTR